MRTKPFETIVRREYLDYLVSENERLKKELVLNKLEPIHLHNCLTKISELEEKNKNARKKVKKLQEQLKIATKALKEYSVSDNWFMEDSDGKCWSFNKQYPWRIGFKALKEMEGVK